MRKRKSFHRCRNPVKSWIFVRLENVESHRIFLTVWKFQTCFCIIFNSFKNLQEKYTYYIFKMKALFLKYFRKVFSNISCYLVSGFETVYLSKKMVTKQNRRIKRGVALVKSTLLACLFVYFFVVNYKQVKQTCAELTYHVLCSKQQYYIFCNAHNISSQNSS